MNIVKTLREEIIDALNEATIMELALSNFCMNHLLETAQKLSLAPFSFVRDVHIEQQTKLKSVQI